MRLESLKNAARQRLSVWVELAQLVYSNFKDHAERTKIEMLLPDPTPPYLKNKVVWCPDCSAKRQLTTLEGMSTVVCETCYGKNWVFYTNKYFFEQPPVNENHN